MTLIELTTNNVWHVNPAFVYLQSIPHRAVRYVVPHWTSRTNEAPLRGYAPTGKDLAHGQFPSQIPIREHGAQVFSEDSKSQALYPHFDHEDWCTKFETHIPKGYYCTRPPYSKQFDRTIPDIINCRGLDR